MQRSAVRAPVMSDVARLAGVSHQTVSRVINDHPNISPPPERRCSEPSTSSATAPTRGARTGPGALGNGRHHHNLGSYFGPRSAQHGVNSAAGRQLRGGLDRPRRRDARRAVHRDRRPEDRRRGRRGRRRHDAAVDAARSRPSELPVVVVEGDLSRAPLSVGVNQVAGATAAVEHLIGLGHRRIDHVAEPADWPRPGRASRASGQRCPGPGWRRRNPWWVTGLPPPASKPVDRSRRTPA